MNSSPYLTYKPHEEYIIPNAAPTYQRGSFELAFTQIGGAVMLGALLGGSVGTVRGLRMIKEISEPSVRRTQLLNVIIKSGTMSANTFGVVALFYSAITVGYSLLKKKD